MTYSFEIPGKPFGKQRPQVKRRRGFSVAITPDRTVNYEATVKTMFVAAYPKHVPVVGAVMLTVRAYYPMPQSASRKRKNAMIDQRELPTVKPDCDNVLKIICDALDGVAWVDDKQVVRVLMTKAYDVRPRVEVTIEEA